MVKFTLTPGPTSSIDQPTVELCEFVGQSVASWAQSQFWIVWLFFLAIMLILILFLCTGVNRIEHGRYSRTDRIDLPTGVTPAGMAILPTGILYVANNNNYGISGSDSVSVWDTNTNTVVTTILDASFNEPYTITAVGSLLYVTNSGGLTITIIDSATNTVKQVVSGFDGPSGMAVTGSIGYVNNYGSAGGVGSGNGTTVSILNLTTNTIIGTITVGLAPAALAMQPASRVVSTPKLYVINYETGNPGTGTISVVNVQSNLVIATIPGLFGPFGLAFTLDGSQLYVTNFGSNNFAPYGTTVSVISTASNTIVQTISTGGIQPSGIAASHRGGYMYVTLYNTLYAGSGFTNLTAGQGTLLAIPLQSDLKPWRASVGQSPSAIVIRNDGRLFVSNYTSNTVSSLSSW